jgi:hypothetical protein
LTLEGIRQDGRQKQDERVELRGVFCGQLKRSLVGAGAVAAGEVEEVPAGGGGGEEVLWAVEGFEVEELTFDGGMGAFDIGVAVGSGGRVEAVVRIGGEDGAVEGVGTR